MTVKINWSPLAIVHYTDNVEEGKGGWAKLCYARIRTKYLLKNDTGILKHELEHVKQFWQVTGLGVLAFILIYLLFNKVVIMPGYTATDAMLDILPFVFLIHNVLYMFNTAYRLRCEINAYAKQLHEYGEIECTDKVATWVSKDYNLNISEASVKILVNQKLALL